MDTNRDPNADPSFLQAKAYIDQNHGRIDPIGSHLLVFLRFFIYVLGGLGGLNYSQMANFDSRVDCNTFGMISGTSKKSTKSRPSDPVFITKLLQKIQENMGTSLDNIIFHI